MKVEKKKHKTIDQNLQRNILLFVSRFQREGEVFQRLKMPTLPATVTLEGSGQPQYFFLQQPEPLLVVHPPSTTRPVSPRPPHPSTTPMSGMCLEFEKGMKQSSSMRKTTVFIVASHPTFVFVNVKVFIKLPTTFPCYLSPHHSGIASHTFLADVY